MNCFGTLIRHRRLIWNLTLLDLKLRYAGTRLGLAWTFLSPLLILFAYLVLFGLILGVRPNPRTTGAEYGQLIACGLLPWIGFSEGMTKGTASVLAQRNLLKSQLFPIEILPVTAVCIGVLIQLVGTLLLLLVLGSQVKIELSIVMLPVLMMVQALLTIGLVWFLSCINILYRDTTQVIGLVMVLLMLISPIAYTQPMVPASLELLVRLNPLSFLIEGYRDALLFGRWPEIESLLAFSGVAILALLAGHRYFVRLRRLLPDYV